MYSILPGNWQHVDHYHHHHTNQQLTNIVNAIPVKRRELLEQQFPVAFDTPPSVDVRGSDIPNDTSTMRFFYNLGHEYFKQLKSKYSMQVLTQLARPASDPENASVTDNEMVGTGGCVAESMSNDFSKLKLEKPINQVVFQIKNFIIYFV